jgi:hypothetical protein
LRLKRTFAKIVDGEHRLRSVFPDGPEKASYTKAQMSSTTR